MGDDFENIYKGEVSKSGQPVLPSKRARKVPEKIKILNEDISELKNENPKEVSPQIDSKEEEMSQDDVSVEDLKEEELNEKEQEES